MNLETVSQNDFALALGTRFTLRAEGGDVLMELEELRPLGHRRTGATRDPFALLFRSETGPILPQATYPVDHSELGGFDLFIVPVGRAPGGGVNYEAIFT